MRNAKISIELRLVMNGNSDRMFIIMNKFMKMLVDNNRMCTNVT